MASFRDMNERTALLSRAYERFNARQVDELLAMMSDDVEWPDVANGGVLRDKALIRSYWAGQFAVADPRVTPVDFIEVGDEVVVVVEQEILALDGSVLVPGATVFHRYAFDGDLVRRMRVFADRDEALGHD
jgi:hypothetical protein